MSIEKNSVIIAVDGTAKILTMATVGILASRFKASFS